MSWLAWCMDVRNKATQLFFARGDMHGEIRNQWSKLRKHAAEQDPQKVLQSARKINCMLERKEHGLTQALKTKTHAAQVRCRK